MKRKIIVIVLIVIFISTYAIYHYTFTEDAKNSEKPDFNEWSGGYRDPRYSSEGNYIVFSYTVTNPEDHKEHYSNIWKMNLTSKEILKLTNEYEYYSNPIFSPDGEKILFNSYFSKKGICEMDANGDNLKLLISDGFSPSYSYDGDKITFIRDGEIWICDKKGLNQVQLTHNSDPVCLNPVFHPNGDSILFTNHDGVYGEAGSLPIQRNIWSVDINNKNIKKISQGPWNYSYPNYNINGTRIVCAILNETGEFIFILDVNTNTTEPITNVSGYSYPSFSPDDIKIICDGMRHIWEISVIEKNIIMVY